MPHTAIYTGTKMAPVFTSIQFTTNYSNKEKCARDAQPFGKGVEYMLKLTRALRVWGTSGVQSPRKPWWHGGGLSEGWAELNLTSTWICHLTLGKLLTSGFAFLTGKMKGGLDNL